MLRKRYGPLQQETDQLRTMNYVCISGIYIISAWGYGLSVAVIKK